MAARSYPQRLKKKWNSKQIKTIKNQNSKIFAIPSAKHFSIIFVLLLLLLFLVICAPVSLLLINYVCKRGTSARASENGKGMNKRDLWWCEMMIIIGESVSTENFPPEFKRVWWFFMCSTPLFIWYEYHCVHSHFIPCWVIWLCVCCTWNEEQVLQWKRQNRFLYNKKCTCICAWEGRIWRIMPFYMQYKSNFLVLAYIMRVPKC